MGYWSDWSVPILVTSAAAFTYIAGLLVWRGWGRVPWWLCSQEGQAWPLRVYRGIGLLSTWTPSVLLGRRRSHFPSLLRLSLWKPLPAIQAEEPFWLSASTTDIFQKLLGLPTHSALHTERLGLSTLSTGSSLGAGLRSASESPNKLKCYAGQSSCSRTQGPFTGEFPKEEA